MEQTGRIIFQAKDVSKVLLSNNEVVLGRVYGRFRNRVEKLSDYPIVGDMVTGLVYDENQFLIESVLPRSSFLQRKVSGVRQDEQGIAANIKTVFITTSVNEEFNLSRLERFTTIVWDSGAVPVFVLTKTDLISDSKLSVLCDVLQQNFLGISIIMSNQYFDPWDKFKSYLIPGEIVTFIGSSGVGKSTLLNQFLGETYQETQEIRVKDARGRHTTTSRELFVLQNGSMIIDTPGMREIGLTTVSAESVEQNYFQIYELAKHCRFSDCRHDTEPGCAVKKALETNQLRPELLKNYRKMEKEIAYLKKKEAHERVLQKKNRKF